MCKALCFSHSSKLLSREPVRGRRDGRRIFLSSLVQSVAASLSRPVFKGLVLCLALAANCLEPAPADCARRPGERGCGDGLIVDTLDVGGIEARPSQRPGASDKPQASEKHWPRGGEWEGSEFRLQFWPVATGTGDRPATAPHVDRVAGTEKEDRLRGGAEGVAGVRADTTRAWRPGSEGTARISQQWSFCDTSRATKLASSRQCCQMRLASASLLKVRPKWRPASSTCAGIPDRSNRCLAASRLLSVERNQRSSRRSGSSPNGWRECRPGAPRHQARTASSKPMQAQTASGGSTGRGHGSELSSTPLAYADGYTSFVTSSEGWANGAATISGT